MSPPDRPNDPVKALAAFIKREDRTVTRFGLRAHIDPAHVRAILKRKRRQLRIDTAILIEDATRGEIPARMWCRPVESVPTDQSVAGGAARSGTPRKSSRANRTPAQVSR